MRIGAYIIAYNEEPVVGAAIRSLKTVVSDIVVAISDKPYFGNPEPPDRTKEIAEKEGCRVFTGYWKREHEQRNFCCEVLNECDVIISSEADMIWEKKDLEMLIDVFSKDSATAARVRQCAYVFDIDHQLHGGNIFKPVTAIKKGVRFVHIANPDCDTRFYEDIKVHHLSWAEPKDVKKKCETYSHAHQIPKGWYDTYFKFGDHIRFHDETFDVVYNPMPKECREYL